MGRPMNHSRFVLISLAIPREQPIIGMLPRIILLLGDHDRKRVSVVLYLGNNAVETSCLVLANSTRSRVDEFLPRLPTRRCACGVRNASHGALVC